MAPKNAKQSSSNSLTIGLDIGYGVTKCVSAMGQHVFPSVFGFGREFKFQAKEIADKHPGDQIWDDFGHWMVGDLALAQLRPHEQLRLRGRGGDEWAFRARLAKVAIGKMLTGNQSGDIVHVKIATGLPVDHMPDSGLMKAALIGQHVIKTDSTHVIANVSEVMVMPQPYGTIYTEMLETDGTMNDCYTAARTGVVDVGTYTIDVTLDDDGEYVDAQSGSIEGGVYTAQEHIAGIIEHDYREKPSYRVVEDVLRTKCLRVRGQEIDFSAEVEEALQPIRTATLNLLTEKWKTGITIDVIYLSGGGAELVLDEIKTSFPQSVLTKNPQLANARGYLKYANFVALQG